MPGTKLCGLDVNPRELSYEPLSLSTQIGRCLSMLGQSMGMNRVNALFDGEGRNLRLRTTKKKYKKITLRPAAEDMTRKGKAV